MHQINLGNVPLFHDHGVLPPASTVKGIEMVSSVYVCLYVSVASAVEFCYHIYLDNISNLSVKVMGQRSRSQGHFFQLI